MNQVFNAPPSDALTEEVHDSHFTLDAKPGELDLINVNGAEGWTSPNIHPVLSLFRWTTQDQATAEAALSDVLARFQQDARGFDWMTGPRTAHLTPLLYENGFLPPPLEVAAMTRSLIGDFPKPQLDGLKIVKSEGVMDPRVSSVMSKGFDVSDDVGAVYHNAYLRPSQAQRTDVYTVSKLDDDSPLAVGYLSYIGNGPSVLLRVSSTLDSHRGRGLYRAMVLHRLHDAAQAGRQQAFVHAYSDSSKRALIDLGFEQTGRLYLHRWRA